MVSTTITIDALTSLASNLDASSVHEIRKLTKQIRACLVLQRALGADYPDNKKMYRLVKKLAHVLCPQRDRTVMDAALGAMAEESSDQPDLVSLLNSLRDRLGSAPLSAHEVRRVQALVREITASAPESLCSTINDSSLDSYLNASLAELRRSGPALLAGDDFDALHAWRKRVKNLMYQWQLKASPDANDLQIVEELEQLGSCLGKVNDMHMLKESLLQSIKAEKMAERQAALVPILDLIDVRLGQELVNSQVAFDRLAN